MCIRDRDILRYSCVDGNGDVDAPAAEEVAKYAIVVATCGAAGLLLCGGLRGTFTHILIDEAAQALEAEALVPLATCGPATRVVLAGDPNQLGAAVRSPFAASKGLGTSLLERLIQRAAKDPGAAQVVVTRADMSAPTVRPTKARLRRVGAFWLSAATMPATPPAITPSDTASTHPAGSSPLLVKSPSSGGLIATGPKLDAMSLSLIHI